MEQEIIIDSQHLRLENVGIRSEAVSVNGESLVIHTPTVAGMQAAVTCLAELPRDGLDSIDALVQTIPDTELAAKSLAALIQADGELLERLRHGTLDELRNALSVGFGLVNWDALKVICSVADGLKKLIGKPKMQ